MTKRRKIVVFLVSALMIIGLVVAGLTSCQTLLVAIMMAWGIDKDYRIEDRRWLDERLAALDPQRRPASSLPALTFGVAAGIMIGQVGDLPGDGTDIHSYGIADKMLDVFRELPIDVIRVGAGRFVAAGQPRGDRPGRQVDGEGAESGVEALHRRHAALRASVQQPGVVGGVPADPPPPDRVPGSAVSASVLRRRDRGEHLPAPSA
jgi:hypothetical protein